MMKLIQQKKIWGLAVAAILLIGLGITMLWRPHASEVIAAEPSDTEEEQSQTDETVDLKTIKPQNNLQIIITVQEPADVEAFYRSDLASQVAGIVTRMPKGLNDAVQKGELLATIDAPDRAQEVAEKASVVDQRTSELDMARMRARVAEAAVNVSRAFIKVAEKDIDWRYAELKRYVGLNRDKVITDDVVDEKRKFYLVAVVNEEKAKADVEEEIAKAEAAFADIKLKETLIVVARKDRDRAQAMLNYATIRAPFDGVIVRRNVDPGDFVQNASTGRTEPVIAVARTDIMTVVMKLPDTYASYVTRDTEAIVNIQGRRIKAKVTRFAPSIHATDRTMRVEVDLFNGSQEEYDRFVLKGVASFLPSFGIPSSCDALGRLVGGRIAWDDNSKGIMDPLPVMPDASTGKFRGPAQRLLPRMYGHMKLLLKNFQNDYLIPSKAIFSVGGTKYVIMVRDGKAHRQAIDVEMNDGTVAKVLLLISKSADGTEPEATEELTGNEEIVANGQSEINDGQPVRAQLTSWPAIVKTKKARP